MRPAVDWSGDPEQMVAATMLFEGTLVEVRAQRAGVRRLVRSCGGIEAGGTAGESGDLGEVVDRHHAGDDRYVDAGRSSVVDEPEEHVVVEVGDLRIL